MVNSLAEGNLRLDVRMPDLKSFGRSSRRKWRTFPRRYGRERPQGRNGRRISGAAVICLLRRKALCKVHRRYLNICGLVERSQKTRFGNKNDHSSSNRLGVPSKRVKKYPLQYFKSHQRLVVLSSPALGMSVDDGKGISGDGFYSLLPDFR